MNILFVLTSLDPYRGGVQRVTWVLSEYFRQKGFDTFFAYDLVDYDRIEADHKIKIDYSLPFEEIYQQLENFVVKNKIDIIINQDRKNAKLLTAYAKIKAKRACKIIHCLHNAPDYFKHVKLTPVQRIKKWGFRLIHSYDHVIKAQQEAYNVADYVVLLSDSFIPDYINLYHIPNRKKVGAISNPLSFHTDISDDFSIEKEHTVLIVARLEERQKNIKAALRIWKEVEATQETDWKLLLAGYGPDEAEILRYATKLQLKRFSFIGRIDKPETLYKKASVFMMTSNYEGFGMTLTEALQYGCIPIAFNTYSAVKDIIQDGNNGYLIAPGDEKTYACKILSLIHDEKLRSALMQNGLNSIAKFQIEAIGQQWLDLFKSLSNEEHIVR